MPFALDQSFLDDMTTLRIRAEKGALIPDEELVVSQLDDFDDTLFRSDQIPIVAMDSRYFLDESYQVYEMTPDVYGFIEAAGFNVNEFLDRNITVDISPKTVYDFISVVTQALRQYYLHWYKTASPEQRAWTALNIVFDTCQFSNIHEYVSDKMVEKVLVQSTEGSNRTLEERIFDEDLLNEVFKEKLGLRLWLRDLKESWRMASAAYEAVDKTSFLEYCKTLINRKNDAFAREHTIEELRGALLTTSQRKKKERLSKRRGRSSLKKSLLLFERVLGADTLKTFLNGEPIWFEGETFDYSVINSSGVVSHTASPNVGHIPYRLNVHTKQTREELAHLCLVFKNTPVLDQIVAFSIHLTNDEKGIVNTANVFGKTDAFYDSPTVKEFFPEREWKKCFGTPIPFEEEDGEVLGGISGRQFREEVLPWRERTREFILKSIGNMTGLGEDILLMANNNQRNIDEIALYQSMNQKTLTDFLR